MSSGFGLVLSPAPPLRLLDHGFVTVTVVISNEEFVFVVQNLKPFTAALGTRCS